jgi:hypothetical protein
MVRDKPRLWRDAQLGFEVKEPLVMGIWKPSGLSLS